MSGTKEHTPGHLALAMTVLGLSVAGALAGIQGTPHDLSSQSWASGEICLPCHASHSASSQPYSWNHAYPSEEAFTIRDGATLGLESLMYLGCHDGQTAIDSFGGVSGTTVMVGSAVVGRDLSDDHPVGVVYPSGNASYRSVGIVEAQLRLYDDRIECGSCHDVHNDTRGRFLRVSGSQLCLICHNM